MRICSVIVVTIWYICIFVCRAAFAIAVGRRRDFPNIVGETLANCCGSLGGAYLKAGQVLSTRVDLLHPKLVAELARLRDNVHPLAFSRLESIIQPLQRSKGRSPLDIDPVPLASATLAQVHIGTILSTGESFAIKIRRPGIDEVLKADVRHMRIFTSIFAHLPWVRRFPIREATAEVCTALLQQLDFQTEASMLSRFRRLFADNPRIQVPDVDLASSTKEFIVMEYLDGFRPFQEFRDQPELARSAVQIGLRALYKMIFNAGLIHCDLHASNILCNEKGQVAMLDFGFVSKMTPKAKQDFSEFFLSIAFCDGKTAARIVRETAIRIGRKHNNTAFEQDMQRLIDKTSGRKAADFQVAGFVLELFQVQRRHGIYGSPSFTLPILSLLTYEGLIKDLYPEIDFQQEAVPFVMSALAVSS